MKNTIITSILVFVLMFQITSCKKENVESNKKIERTSKSGMQETNDTIFDRKNVFYAFIQKNHPQILKENKLMSFYEKDIDLDGINEGIVALGQYSDDSGIALEHLFILKNNQGVIKEIICDFEKYRSFFISNICLISLQDKKQSYLLLGGMDDGFVIFELVNNKLKEICVSQHSEYDGGYEFIDLNSDGKYEGYIHKEINIIPTENYFVFENGVARKTNTKVVIPDYPNNIKDVIYQYIGLQSLGATFCKIPQVKERIDQLCIDKSAADQKWERSAWNHTCAMYLSDKWDGVQFDIEEKLDSAIVFVDCDDCKTLTVGLRFELQKSGNKWQITAVDVLELHE